MRFDRQQRPWLLGCATAFVVASACWWLVRRDPLVPLTGGSTWGLVFGSAAATCMAVAVALTLRKRLSTWRLGKTHLWLQGHVWLSVLALPLVLFHGDFRFGGTLTSWLMALFLASWASGVIGVALQHWLPRMMTEQVARETIYEQIDHVAELLRDEARALVEKCYGPIDGPPHPLTAQLRDFYVAEVAPLLAAARTPRGLFEQTNTSPMRRAHLKRLLPAELHGTVDDLFDLCDERRQLELQRRLHHWLHGWLLFHVPVSWATVALAFWHALIALRYT